MLKLRKSNVRNMRDILCLQMKGNNFEFPPSFINTKDYILLFLKIIIILFRKSFQEPRHSSDHSEKTKSYMLVCLDCDSPPHPCVLYCFSPTWLLLMPNVGQKGKTGPPLYPSNGITGTSVFIWFLTQTTRNLVSCCPTLYITAEQHQIF